MNVSFIGNQIKTSFMGWDNTDGWNEAYHIHAVYDLNGYLASTWKSRDPINSVDYNVLEFGDTYTTAYGSALNTMAAPTGFIYQFSGVPSNSCYFDYVALESSSFTDYVSNTGEPYTFTDFTNEESITVSLTDITMASSSFCQTLGTTPVDGIEDPIVVYPNPSNGLFQFSNLSQASQIEIRDIKGLLVHAETVQYSNPTIDSSSKGAGVYFYSINTATGVETGKIIIE